ncbi:MAG: hypothetical protein KBT08_02945 [Bacteroidales bacterium]|nr:hypothetical protein [Candidatus Cryptobacteroides onthequi]
MKRHLLIFVLFISICALALLAVSVSVVVKSRTNDRLFIANVEALARTEGDSSTECYMRESYGVKMYATFCFDNTTGNLAYPCSSPEVSTGATKRHCYR